MNNYDLEKEKQMHPYKYYGKVKEEKHGEGTFLMRSALHYVIDAYDEYIESVEQSHYEDLGYYEVTNFNLPDTVDTLDLTWMKNEDVFKLKKSEQYSTIDTIIVNVDNLYCSHLPKRNNSFYGNSIPNKNIVNLIIKAENSHSNYIKQIRAFKKFISNNEVKSVTFVGFNKAVENILMIYAKKAEIPIVQDKTNEEEKRQLK